MRIIANSALRRATNALGMPQENPQNTKNCANTEPSVEKTAPLPHALAFRGVQSFL
jgi:hypothetical protein